MTRGATTSTGTSDAIIDTLSASGPASIYDLARVLGWSYGKTERRVKALIGARSLFSTTATRNNRVIKLVSVQPFDNMPSRELDAPSPLISTAFNHLYGIFKELKHVNQDPTKGLLAYCEKINMDPARLVGMLDEASTATRTMGDGGAT